MALGAARFCVSRRGAVGRTVFCVPTLRLLDKRATQKAISSRPIRFCRLEFIWRFACPIFVCVPAFSHSLLGPLWRQLVRHASGAHRWRAGRDRFKLAWVAAGRSTRRSLFVRSLFVSHCVVSSDTGFGGTLTPLLPSQQSQLQSSVQQTESQVRQQQAVEAHRQQEALRQQVEAQVARQQQAVAEAQARHQSQQNHLQQQQQNHHQQNHQVHHNLHPSLQQHHNNQLHHLVDHHTDQLKPNPVHTPVRSRMPRGSKADPRPRGRMTAYAFFVQTCREEHKKKHPEENVVFAEFSKKCAERWKTMLDKEKKRFQEMAEKDKKRYDSEMQNYTPPKGEKQRGKKRKQSKDPNAPKRSLSAFFWFCNDERAKVKSQNPEYGVGDIAKELGRRWADADSELKSKYEAMAEKDKARYEKEMTAYKKKNNPALPVAPVPEPEEEDEEEEEMDDEEDD